MFSTEQRRVAIETFIKFDHSYADTVAELGYPTKTCLRNWWKEYEQLSCTLKECDPSDAEQLRKVTEAISGAPTYDVAKRRARKWNAQMDGYLNDILESEERKDRALGTNKQALTGV